MQLKLHLQIRATELELIEQGFSEAEARARAVDTFLDSLSDAERQWLREAAREELIRRQAKDKK